MTDPAADREGAAFLLFFDDAARPLHKRLPAAPLPRGTRSLHVLGYPTLMPSRKTLQGIERALGVPAVAWPAPLTPARHAAVVARSSERAEQAACWSTDAVRSYIDAKANDRVYYRLLPLALAEDQLAAAIAATPDPLLVVPWLADRFDLVERSGLLASLDAPGHQIVASLERLRAVAPGGLRVHELWPDESRREAWTIPAARAAMLAARSGILLARSLRERVTPTAPARAARPSRGRRLGFMVGGAAAWSSLSPLVEATRAEHDVEIFSYDIMRNPTAFTALKASGVPFRPLDGMLGPAALARTLLSSVIHAERARRHLRASAARSSGEGRELALVLEGDLAAMPELEAYSSQLTRAIREHELDCVVTANCIDAFLTVTTETCRRAGIQHVCIQNAAMEPVRLPRVADSDLYFAQSERFAEALRNNGARGRVEAVGLPYYDTLVRARDARGHGAVLRAFPQLQGRKIVTIATQTELVDMRPVIERAIAWASGRQDVGLVLKLHPREPANAWRDLGDELTARGLGGRIHTAPIMEVLADSNVLLSSTSTTILWAIVMGVRPISAMDRSWAVFAEELDYLRPEVTSTFENPAEAVGAVAAALDDPSEQIGWEARRRGFLAEYVTGADGHASRRILEAILASLR